MERQTNVNMPRLDVSKIDDVTAAYFARITLRKVNEYFQQPGVQERFEAWCAENGLVPGASEQQGGEEV